MGVLPVTPGVIPTSVPLAFDPTASPRKVPAVGRIAPVAARPGPMIGTNPDTTENIVSRPVNASAISNRPLASGGKNPQ